MVFAVHIYYDSQASFSNPEVRLHRRHNGSERRVLVPLPFSLRVKRHRPQVITISFRELEYLLVAMEGRH